MAEKSVLVVGATGNVGAGLVKELLRGGHKVVAATRSPEKYHGSERSRAVRFDFREPKTYSAALEGVDRMFLMAPPGSAADQLMSRFLDRAMPGVKRVVIMTAEGVENDENIPLRKLERMLERAGTDWTFLRPNWFMQNFGTGWLPGIKATGAIAVPAANARSAFVDTRDISASAAACLFDDRRVHKAYTLTGPAALTYAEAAEILAHETGRKIAYKPIEEDEFRAGLLKAGMEKDYANVMVALFQSVRAGNSAQVTGDVEDLTGKKPRTLTEYARDHKQLFA
jgi:uncharacterized protein YbjT (DUF2867 family)